MSEIINLCLIIYTISFIMVLVVGILVHKFGSYGLNRGEIKFLLFVTIAPVVNTLFAVAMIVEFGRGIVDGPAK